MIKEIGKQNASLSFIYSVVTFYCMNIAHCIHKVVIVSCSMYVFRRDMQTLNNAHEEGKELAKVM